MKIQNQIELELDEAVFLLHNLADNLQQTNKFNFELKGQSASVEVGPDMVAHLSFEPTQFALTFTWREEQTEPTLESKPPIQPTANNLTDWVPAKSSTAIPTPNIASSPTITDKTSEPPIDHPPIKTVKPKTSETIPISTGSFDAAKTALPVNLQTRMMLNSTTLPYEGGFWTSAFTLDQKTYWSEIVIYGELENTKWASEEQINSLSALSPSKKPVRRTISGEETDDLFSDLDSTSKKPVSETEGETKFVRPAGMIGQSIGLSSNISQDELVSAVAEWKEPTPEDNVSGDDWVKPSEILKKKKTVSKPIQKEMDPVVSTKVRSIPSPSSQSSSADEWVKPSELLKQDKKTKTTESKIKEKRERPPPTAPDKKRKERKKKGWAKW